MTHNSRRSFLKIAAAATFSIALPAFLSGCGEKHDEHNSSGTIYTCSMHPQIRSNKPGRCPICGMTLTPLAQKAEESSTHDEKTSSDEVKLMPSQDSVASIVAQPAATYALVHTALIYGEIREVQDTQVDFTWVYSGRVEKLLVSYNTTEVSKSQPIMEVYSEDAIADQQAYLQALRERYLTTFYERKIATSQMEVFRSKLLRAGMTDGELEDLVKNKKIKTTFTITSPISGSLISRLPANGERIMNNNVLFRIATLEQVWFAGKVFEQDIASLAPAQEIELETKARPGTKYRGKLVFIDRAIDPATRTIQARFIVNNPKRELLPDMSATGYLKVAGGTPSIVVPSSAIIDTGKRKVLYVLTAPHTYQQREVSVGAEGNVAEKDGSFVEIKSGLKEGEEVVTSGAFLVDAEAQLRGISTHHQEK